MSCTNGAADFRDVLESLSSFPAEESITRSRRFALAARRSAHLDACTETVCFACCARVSFCGFVVRVWELSPSENSGSEGSRQASNTALRGMTAPGTAARRLEKDLEVGAITTVSYPRAVSREMAYEKSPSPEIRHMPNGVAYSRVVRQISVMRALSATSLRPLDSTCVRVTPFACK